MSLASVIHHGILAPAKSDRIFLSIPVVPPDFRGRGWTESRFSLLINPALVSAASRRLPHPPCSRDIDQEDDVSSSAGLRSLYTLISEGMGELEYLQPSTAVVLGFIGFKVILDFFGFHVSTEASLGIMALSLSTKSSDSELRTENRFER